MNNIYWVGPRESDINDTGDFFKGSVTIFGTNKNGNIAYCTDKKRINHNMPDPQCDLFFIKTLKELCRKDASCQFMFYKPMLAYQYGEEIVQRALCLNSPELLNTFSDKRRCRYILRNIVNTIPFVILRGAECCYSNLCNYFIGHSEFVIQKAFSSGGEGTFHINSRSEIHFLSPHDEYLVSPYINDGISINAHIIIFEEDILFIPPSIQIVLEREQRLLYCGGDYICYKMLPDNVKTTVYDSIERVGCYVQSRGYRGILGIDFILNAGQVFFVEINTRFQGSSQLVNKTLYPYANLSLQEINLLAFSDARAPTIDIPDIKFSNFAYTTSNISMQRLNQISKSDEVFRIQWDGFSQDSVFPKQKNVYLCRFLFNQNICSISNGRVILHPNIYVEDIKQILDSKDVLYKEYIKNILLNHGALLSDQAKQLAKQFGKIKEAVFDAIDAIIFENVYVNIPCYCKFTSFSPFTIEVAKERLVLFFDGKLVSDIDVFFAPDSLLDRYTKSNVPFDAIINLATDRIRINPAPVCVYKRKGVPCKFCNLPESNFSYGISDIKEIIDYCLSNVDFRHFLIGGGTYSSKEDEWSVIIELTKYIRANTDKDIYLMSVPPANVHILEDLKNAGITEVAFNLEIFDREKAKEYMPGKGCISKDQYISALTHAVSLWGNTGRVRSLLIYGFDTDHDFLNGIEDLCSKGVEPIISIFRPLRGTEFGNLNPPPTKDIISIYNRSQEIVKKYSLILGPDCPKCQNNTLSFAETN